MRARSAHIYGAHASAFGLNLDGFSPKASVLIPNAAREVRGAHFENLSLQVHGPFIASTLTGRPQHEHTVLQQYIRPGIGVRRQPCPWRQQHAVPRVVGESKAAAHFRITSASESRWRDLCACIAGAVRTRPLSRMFRSVATQTCVCSRISNPLTEQFLNAAVGINVGSFLAACSSLLLKYMRPLAEKTQ
jgi:hypothetical protein